MIDPFKPRPLLLKHIQDTLAQLGDPSADSELVSVDLGEIFYDFWEGEGLLRRLLEAHEPDQIMGVLVDLQILLEHLQRHIGEAVKGVNRITKMAPQVEE